MQPDPRDGCTGPIAAKTGQLGQSFFCSTNLGRTRKEEPQPAVDHTERFFIFSLLPSAATTPMRWR